MKMLNEEVSGHLLWLCARRLAFLHVFIVGLRLYGLYTRTVSLAVGAHHQREGLKQIARVHQSRLGASDVASGTAADGQTSVRLGRTSAAAAAFFFFCRTFLGLTGIV